MPSGAHWILGSRGGRSSRSSSTGVTKINLTSNMRVRWALCMRSLPYQKWVLSETRVRVPLTKVSDRFDPSNATSCVRNIPLYQITYDSKGHPPGSLQVIIQATRSDSQWFILSSGPLSTSVTCEDNWGDSESGTIWTKSRRCLLTNRIIVGIFRGMSTSCRSILLCSLLHSLTYECPVVPNGGS